MGIILLLCPSCAVWLRTGEQSSHARLLLRAVLPQAAGMQPMEGAQLGFPSSLFALDTTKSSPGAAGNLQHSQQLPSEFWGCCFSAVMSPGLAAVLSSTAVSSAGLEGRVSSQLGAQSCRFLVFGCFFFSFSFPHHF